MHCQLFHSISAALERCNLQDINLFAFARKTTLNSAVLPKVHANLECLELPNIVFFFFSCQRFCDCCVAKIFVYRWPFNPTRVLLIYYLSQRLQIRELAVGTLQSKYRFCLSAMNYKLSSFCKQYLHVYNFLLK